MCLTFLLEVITVMSLSLNVKRFPSLQLYNRQTISFFYILLGLACSTFFIYFLIVDKSLIALSKVCSLLEMGRHLSIICLCGI